MLEKNYTPKDFEEKIYADWENSGDFQPDMRSSSEAFSIVIPPPNVTGVLHLGHALDDTLQDILVRYNRMQGKKVLWQPGTDHAGIATQMVVERNLAKEGVSRHDLGREKFIETVWKWKEQSGGTICKQLRRLGASCDWSRERFTMDEGLSRAVRKIFVNMYKDGLIYKAKKLVNWDSKFMTAVSDLEVVQKETVGKMYYYKYPIENEPGEFIHIATTRPETMFGDTAVAVSKDNEKLKHLIGKNAILPIVNRPIPIVADDHADPEKGTGAVKITPAHDFNDFEVGKRHNLPMINILNEDATLNENTPFPGMDTQTARRKTIEKLEELGLMEKIEDHPMVIPYGDRSGVVIEPLMTDQWFVDAPKLAVKAIEAVENGDMEFVPKSYEKTYFEWMRNIQPWCISRQLWWGHQMPIWYGPDGEIFCEENVEEAQAAADKHYGKHVELTRETDVLDTWFSSGLWAFSTLGWPDKSDYLDTFYPTSVLVTGFDIIFFWVARMIMAGYEYEHKLPFRNVYFTGIVRDKIGRKMSKSLGNSPDALELIKTYGADGVRMGLMLAAPAGNDILYDDALCEQGRNFNNKIWNAFRLVKGWNVDETLPQPQTAAIAVEWFDAQLNRTLEEVKDLFGKYRLSEALMAIYKLFWDEFSSWYLEMVKPAYQQPIDRKTYDATLRYFDALLRMLHPFMPFITEELWQHLYDRKEGESIMTARMPEPQPVNMEIINRFETTKLVVAGIRTIRLQKGIANKEQLTLQIIGAHDHSNDCILTKMTNLATIETIEEKDPAAASFRVHATEYAIPMSNAIDVEAELKKLEAELKYAQGFLKTVMGKLGNERFVQNAPEAVVAMERKKKADAEEKIKSLEESIAALKK